MRELDVQRVSVREFVEAARLLGPELPNARFQLLGPIDEGNRTAISRSQLDWSLEAQSNILPPPTMFGRSSPQRQQSCFPPIEKGCRAPFCRDVVCEGLNGFLCTAGDPGSLAGAMRKLAQLQPEQRLAMSEAAQMGVQQRFSEEFVVRTYLEVLASLHPPRLGT